MYGIYGYGASLAAVPRDGGTGSSPEASKKGARTAKPPRGAAQEGPALHARMTLDISALNKQYGRLLQALQRHKQANIIINCTMMMISVRCTIKESFSRDPIHRRSVIEAKEAIAYPVFGHAVEFWG